MIVNPTRDLHTGAGTPFQRSKRRRYCDEVLQGLSHLEREGKRRRVLSHEQPALESSLNHPNADLAVLMRSHVASLEDALRTHWDCVCQKCSGLSVRLALPEHQKDLEVEASFEIFFGVRSVPATALQEAKITVRYSINEKFDEFYSR